MEREERVLSSYRYELCETELINLDEYSKDIIMLNEHHYTSDLLFLDRIRHNAKKLGYLYERKLEIDEYISREYTYIRFNLFTKIDTECNNEFPMDKIVVFRAWSYQIERYAGYLWIGCPRYEVAKASKYPDIMNLFCGRKGFEWNQTSEMNPINTIVIVIVDEASIALKFATKYHQNYVLFSVISTSDPHKVVIGPDINRIKDLTYEKKIEELKFLLGLTDDIEGVSKFVYEGDRYTHLFNK